MMVLTSSNGHNPAHGEEIDVAFAVNESYVQHLAVVMLSILSHASRGDHYHFHVLGDKLSSQSIQTIGELAGACGAEASFPEVDFGLFNELALENYGRVAYGRLLIPDVVDRDKVLYLDCDVLVRDDLGKLWRTDVSSQVAAAVTDFALNADHAHRQELGIPTGAAYFNSGVMLLDISKCRQGGLMRAAACFMKNNRNKLVFADQDGLNAVMARDWLSLHPRWNVQTSMFRNLAKRKYRGRWPDEIVEAVKRPAVVHFTEHSKPWHYTCVVPYAEEYWRYLRMTPWKNYVPGDRTLCNRLFRYRTLLKRNIKRMVFDVRG